MCRVVAERVEEISARPEFRECFAVAVAKAIAPLNILLELAFPLLRNGGVLMAWKGPAVETELQQAARALEVLAGAPGDANNIGCRAATPTASFSTSKSPVHPRSLPASARHGRKAAFVTFRQRTLNKPWNCGHHN